MSRYRHCLYAALILAAGCEVGDGDFDASFGFGDSGPDASKHPEDDAGADDAGQEHPNDKPDAAGQGETTPDAAVGDAGSMPEPAKPGALAKTLASGSCAALTSCLGPRLLMDSLSGQDCVSYRTHLYEDRDLHWLDKSVSNGRVKFRPELLAKCEADLAALGCEVQTRRLPQSCIDVADGDAAPDDACAIDQECKGGAFCDKGSLETCPGTCASLQTSGLPCRTTAQCVDGLICRDGACGEPLVEGDECTVPLTAAMGTGYRECPPGLVCLGSSNNLRCQSIATVFAAKSGEQCQATGKLCELGLVCQSQSAGSTTGICAATSANGGTCRPAIPSQCPSGQYCKDSRANVSARAPAGTDGICSDLPNDGKSCETAVGCQPGAACFDDDTCHSLKTVGQQCSENRECYGGSCLADTCTTPLDCSL
jgi:hypothetical protein